MRVESDKGGRGQKVRVESDKGHLSHLICWHVDREVLGGARCRGVGG